MSYYHFRYDWNYTPQVSVRQTIRDQVFMVDSGCDYRDKEDGGGGGGGGGERRGRGRGETTIITIEMYTSTYTAH